jgi:dihydrofolate reductase
MGRLVVSEFVSLDGVMEDPGGAEQYEHGGWTMAYGSEELYRVKYDELFAADAMLLGRVTYEGFARAWPTMEGTGDFGERMNGIHKYVVSGTLKQLDWNNSTLLEGDVAEGVAKLKQQYERDILVGGSATLVQALTRHNLVDEYTLLVYPIVLGSGKRLFANAGKRPLRLVESRPVGSGVLLLRYEPSELGAGG